LTETIRPEADPILCGKVSIDNRTTDGVACGNARIPHVSVVSKIDGRTSGNLIAHRESRIDRSGGGRARRATEQGLNEPRYPSLPGIMKAKKKPIEEITSPAIGCDPAVGSAVRA
jgi:electron transfer flavoprotein beta subunit